MRNAITLLFISSIVLVLCKENDEPENRDRSLSINEVRFLLSVAQVDGNLITEIEVENEHYVINFESGNSVSIKADLLESYQLDSATWVATFTFMDQSEESAWFLSDLRIDESDFILNPYLTSPLTALTQLKTPVNGKFKVAVKGKPGGVTIEKQFEYCGETHELPILGLYENYVNQIEMVFLSCDNKPRCSRTISLSVPEITKPDIGIQVLLNQPTLKYDGLYVVFSHKIAFDQTGAVRWFYSGEGATFFCKLKNGNFISSVANNLSFMEVTMLGKIVKKYAVPFGLHHEIFEMPSGNFLVASHSPPGAPHEDVVVEISRSAGEIVKTWDFKSILDPHRTPLPDTHPDDWLHINAMYYDEVDNTIVISGRSQSAVVKIDYESGAIKWILGNHNYWTQPFSQFLLKPVNANGLEIDISGTDFWFDGQHAIQKTSKENVLMYDNGDFRGFYDDPTVSQNSYTRLVEYKINEQLKSVQLVWKFDHNKNLFTKFTGYAQELPETNSRLAAYMWISENTPRIIEIDVNNQIIFEATLKQNNSVYYRAFKLDVYSGIN